MKIESISDRILARCPGFALVGGAAQFDTARHGLARLPAAFVLPARDRASPNSFLSQGVVQQQIGSEFAVLIAARNLEDATGAATADELNALRAEIRAALLNWTPEGAEIGCEYVAGEILGFEDAVILWQEIYRTEYMIRSE